MAYHIMAAYRHEKTGLPDGLCLRPQHKLASQPFRSVWHAIWWARYLAEKKPHWVYVIVDEENKDNIVWNSTQQYVSIEAGVKPQTGFNILTNLLFWRRWIAAFIAEYSDKYKTNG